MGTEFLSGGGDYENVLRYQQIGEHRAVEITWCKGTRVAFVLVEWGTTVVKRSSI